MDNLVALRTRLIPEKEQHILVQKMRVWKC